MINSEGRYCVSFEGKHNKVKCLSFTLLNQHWLGSSELALMVDSSPGSIRTLLSRWTRWHLVHQNLDDAGDRKYILSRKGYSWLSKHWRELQLPLRRWVSELPESKQGTFGFLFRATEDREDREEEEAQ